MVEQAKAPGVLGANFARDRQHNDLESAGGIVLAKAWDPWIGRWDGRDVREGEKSISASSLYRYLTFPF
jgi:hypothetical protein